MLRRIKDLADVLVEGPLVNDVCGDDYEHAATALQALTVILATRDVRAKMPRWETVREGGRMVQRLRPENAPTPEEVAANERRMQEMLESGQAPAVSIFDPNSTSLRNPDGSPVTSHRQYEAAKKAKGVEEVSRYDVVNHVGVKSESEKKREEEQRIAETFQRAKAFGKATGQIDSDGNVVAGAPVIPMPVVERPDAIKPREVEDKRPAFEDIPVAQRTRANPAAAEGLIRSLTSRAGARAAAIADARKVHPVLAGE